MRYTDFSSEHQNGSFNNQLRNLVLFVDFHNAGISLCLHIAMAFSLILLDFHADFHNRGVIDQNMLQTILFLILNDYI